jgi:hypothetical protein
MMAELTRLDYLDSEDTTSMHFSNLRRCATVEYPVISKKTTLINKLLTCENATLMPNLSVTLQAELTSKAKDFKPFENTNC